MPRNYQRKTTIKFTEVQVQKAIERVESESCQKSGKTIQYSRNDTKKTN